jgi:hypothetical protein
MALVRLRIIHGTGTPQNHSRHWYASESFTALVRLSIIHGTGTPQNHSRHWYASESFTALTQSCVQVAGPLDKDDEVLIKTRSMGKWMPGEVSGSRALQMMEHAEYFATCIEKADKSRSGADSGRLVASLMSEATLVRAKGMLPMLRSQHQRSASPSAENVEKAQDDDYSVCISLAGTIAGVEKRMISSQLHSGQVLNPAPYFLKICFPPCFARCTSHANKTHA